MKKIFSFILILINFVSLFLLCIIININMLTKEKNISKLTNKINYLDYVNIDSKSEIGDIYDNIYLELQDSLTSKEISIIYDSKYIRKVTSKIIYDGVSLLLYNKNYKLTTNYLNDKVDFNNTRIDNAVRKINYNFVTINNIVKYRVSSISINKTNLIRFLFKPGTKVILLTLIILSIIILYLLNGEKILKIIFVPAIICGLLDILIAITIPIFLKYIYKDLFVIKFLNVFIKEFGNRLFIYGIVIIFISIIYLLINDRLEEKIKIVVKPKLKKIKSVKWFKITVDIYEIYDIIKYS